ncbi:MAG: hypothetical protein ACE5JS_02375 [Nitrospinota bacterium]
MVMDSAEFARKMIQRAEEYARLMEEKVYTSREPLSEERVIGLLKSQMYREFHLGVMPPSKQLTLIPDTETNLKILITRQLCEEFLHYKVLSDRLEEMGANGDLSDYEPLQEDLDMYRLTYEYQTPWEIAASLQVFGETILITSQRWMIEVLDPRSAEIMRDEILVHEGSHVRNGRLVLERYATTEEIQRRVEEIGDLKYRQICKSYGLPMLKTFDMAASGKN